MNQIDLNYPEGSILFDVRYYRKPECFEVIYWSPITKQLEVQYEQAIADIWFLKEEYRTNKYQISQVEIDKCYPVYCKVSDIPKAIATNIGGEYKEFFDGHSAEMRQNDLAKHMCECPWVFKADFSPDVYFRLRWLQKYGDQIDVSKVTFSFLDIECDVIDKTIDPKDVKDVTQPVNAVTLILPEQKICAVMVLGPRPKHKLHPKFHNLLLKQEVEYNWMINNQEEFKRMIKEEDDDNKKYLRDYEIRLHFFDYSDEIKLIKTVFDYINKYRPMFCLSWNGKFDQNYLFHRVEYLGYDPKDFFIPEAFKTDQIYYHEDNSGNFSFKNSSDWFYTSTYTVYICQLRLFAMIRKSQAERRSYSLSSVGKDIAKIDKLTQTKSGTFRQFAYTDFIKFILYNVRDVVVQLAIELKSNDCQSLVGRSYMFATQYAKCFKETHIVRNIREFIFEQEGFVQACTLLIDPTLDTAFKGAFVAPPEHNKPTGLILNGKRINLIMYGVLDADAASYYPSTKMGMNMDPMSLLYKCIIDNTVFQNGMCTNTSFNQTYIWHDSKNRPHAEDMTGPLMNTYKNKNECSLMSNWFNEPTISEVFEHLDIQFGINN
jgi:hypothetical protein